MEFLSVALPALLILGLLVLVEVALPNRLQCLKLLVHTYQALRSH